MQFVSHDPPEFLDSATMREVFVHHEAGHLLLLYYYGWQIGRFLCEHAGPVWTGSIRNQRIQNPPVLDTAKNLKNEARKLLAGELAARIRMGLPTDQIVFPLDFPPPETLTAQTHLDDLHPPADQRYDGIRVLARYVHNRRHLSESWWARTKLFCTCRPQITWWTWIWDLHAEAAALLQAHWQIVEALSVKLMTVEPDHLDAATGNMVGQASGDVLIHWCEQVGAPIANKHAHSISF